MRPPRPPPTPPSAEAGVARPSGEDLSRARARADRSPTKRLQEREAEKIREQGRARPRQTAAKAKDKKKNRRRPRSSEPRVPPDARPDRQHHREGPSAEERQAFTAQRGYEIVERNARSASGSRSGRARGATLC